MSSTHSPSKRSCVRSPSCSHSCSRSPSPPRHHKRRHGSPDHNHRNNYLRGRRGHATTSGKGKGGGSIPSFFQGGTAVCGSSTCVVCLGHHEHDYAKCDASKLWNGAKACVRRNEHGWLVFLDGLPLCFSFQTMAGCSDTSHPSRHVCSGCGKSGHGTQQCAQAQKN